MTENYLYQLADRAIKGILTDEESTALNAWIAESADNLSAFAEIKSILEISDATMSAVFPDTDSEWNKLAAIMDNNSADEVVPVSEPIVLPIWKKSKFWAAAAAVAILALVGIYAISADSKLPNSASLYASNIGQQKQIKLSDGSLVSLNGGSSVETSADYGQNSRHLSLVGEAYFEVAEDKTKPFVVTAGQTTAEALGTKFNVRKGSKSEEVQLSVVEGKVRFADLQHKHELILVANQVAHFDPSTGLLVMDGDDAIDEAAWLQQKLIFKDQAFPKAIERIERQYGVSIQFPSRLNSARLTANFDHKELPQVLEVLEAVYGVKASQAENVVSLVD